MRTPFDGPVVPEVYMIMATSPGEGVTSSRSAGARSARTSGNARRRAVRRHTGVGVAGSPMITMASAATAPAATSRRFAARRSSTTTTRGSALWNWCWRNAPRRPVLTGTQIAPSFAAANSISTDSARLPTRPSTRSPARTPSAASDPASSSVHTSSERKVKAWPSSKRTNGRSPCSAAWRRSRWISVHSRHGARPRLLAGSATRRTVSGSLRQEQGVEAFVGRHEDGGLELLHGPAPRDGHGERRGIDGAGHVEEHEHVVVAERVVPGENLTAKLLDDRLERLHPVLGPLDQLVPRGIRVGRLHHVSRHRGPPRPQCAAPKTLRLSASAVKTRGAPA